MAHEWLDQHLLAVMDKQRSSADNYRLVVTFATGISAAIVAAALQTKPDLPETRNSVIVLCGAAVLAVFVSVLDRLEMPDHAALLQRSALHQWSSSRLTAEFRTVSLSVVKTNHGMVRAMRWAVLVQLFTAFAAGLIASLGLM